MLANPSQAYAVPLTGNTVTMTTEVVVIDPAGTLANLTVNVPASPTRGQEATMLFTQIITALVVGGGTILNGPTAATANGCFKFIYNDDIKKWARVL